jgi:hypothetical protein
MRAPMGAIAGEMTGAGLVLSQALLLGHTAGKARRIEREATRARGVDAVQDLAGRLRSARAGEAEALDRVDALVEQVSDLTVETGLLNAALRAERARYAALEAAYRDLHEAYSDLAQQD